MISFGRFYPVFAPVHPIRNDLRQFSVFLPKGDKMKTETQKSAIEVGVLILYDNVCAGKRAKELCDRLQLRLGSEYELNLSLWNLAALKIPALAQAAAEMAARSGWLLLAMSGGESLPPFVRSWVSQYARQARVADGVIFAQLHGILQMERDIAPAYDDLKRIAHETGVKFFSEVVEPADSDLDKRINEIHQRAHMLTPVLAEILQLP